MKERTNGGHWYNLASTDIKIQKVEKYTIE